MFIHKNSENGGQHSFVGDLLVLCALFSAAFVQPILSMLGESATFFVAHDAQKQHVILFVVTVVLALPFMAAILGWAVKIVAKNQYRKVFQLIMLVLGFLLGLILFRNVTGFNPYITILASVVFSVIINFGLERIAVFRAIAAWSSIGLLVAPILFLGFSQASGIVWEETSSVETNPSIKSDTPVVVIAFDEFNPIALTTSNNEIDATRFPNFHRLAQKSTWYPNASAMHIQSFKAVPSLLSGMAPPDDDPLPSSSSYPINIFSLLGDTYDFNVVESFTALCSPKYCFDNSEGGRFNVTEFYADLKIITKHLYYPSSWAKAKLPPLDAGWKNFGIKKTSEDELNDVLAEKKKAEFFYNDPYKSVESFISKIDNQKNSLHLIHTILPHTPWVHLQDGRTYQYDNIGRDWVTQAKADEAYHRYLLQLGAMDKLIGGLIDQLERVGIYEEAMIIVTADHGLIFQKGVTKRGDDDVRGFESTKASALRVPFFIKYPEQITSKVDTRFVQNIDLVPTVIDVLESSSKETAFDGQSLISSDYKERSEIKFLIRGVEKTYSKEEILSGVSIPNRIQKFGENTPLDEVVVSGTHSDLFKKSYEDIIAVSGVSSLEPNIDLISNEFSNVSLDVDFLPAFLNMDVELVKSSKKELHILVTLNKNVAAIVPLTGDGESRNIRAMLPSRFFKEGYNKIAAFLIVGSDYANREIFNIPIDDVKYELKPGLITNTNLGESYDILDKGNTKGGLVKLIKLQTKIQADGWAADLKNKKCADIVLWFEGDKFLGWSKTGLPTRQLAARYESKSLAKCRFSLKFEERNITKIENVQGYGLYSNQTSLIVKQH